MNMNYAIMLDSETCGDLDCPFAYDIGFAVINLNNGEVVEDYSFVVAEIFTDRELMKSAYFAEKLPQYWEDVVSGKRTMRQLRTIRKTLCDVMRHYHTNLVVAHNARFDYLSTATTQRYLTCSKYRYFFPFGTKIVCTLKMARKALKNDDDYGTFCYENDYMTARGQRRYTAEILYRYLTDDNNFIESHTGLEDVLIEKEILMFCLQFMEIEDGILW